MGVTKRFDRGAVSETVRAEGSFGDSIDPRLNALDREALAPRVRGTDVTTDRTFSSVDVLAPSVSFVVHVRVDSHYCINSKREYWTRICWEEICDALHAHLTSEWRRCSRVSGTTKTANMPTPLDAVDVQIEGTISLTLCLCLPRLM